MSNSVTSTIETTELLSDAGSQSKLRVRSESKHPTCRSLDELGDVTLLPVPSRLDLWSEIWHVYFSQFLDFLFWIPWTMLMSSLRALLAVKRDSRAGKVFNFFNAFLASILSSWISSNISLSWTFGSLLLFSSDLTYSKACGESWLLQKKDSLSTV